MTNECYFYTTSLKKKKKKKQKKKQVSNIKVKSPDSDP